MWDYIERNINKVPDFIKLILNRNGFDNPLTLKDITENHIADIENSINEILRSNKPSDIIYTLNNYISTYDVNPKNFKITNGHKILIFNIKKIINEQGMSLFQYPSMMEDRKPVVTAAVTKKRKNERGPNQTISKYRQKPVVEVHELTDDLKIFLEKKLLSSVNVWIKNSSNAKNPIFVTSVKAMLNNRKQIEGLVQCSYCERQIKVQCTNSRWIVTNYSRHFNKHTRDRESLGDLKKNLFSHYLIQDNNSLAAIVAKPELKIVPKFEMEEVEEEEEEEIAPYVESEEEDSSYDIMPINLSEPPISTRVLDLTFGCPAEGVQVSLCQQIGDTWSPISEGKTNKEGRLERLINRCDFTEGCYRLKYGISDYYKRRDVPSFHPFVDIVFNVNDTEIKHQISLFITPFGYSTFRET